MVTELVAHKDWPDFPTGPLKRGDRRISENFIWYDISAGRFARVRSAHYRSGSFDAEIAYAQNGRDTPTDCPAAPGMSVGKFASYIDAFNRDDYSSFGSYYDADVELVIAGKTLLRGRQAIFDYYRKPSKLRRDVRSKSTKSLRRRSSWRPSCSPNLWHWRIYPTSSPGP